MELNTSSMHLLRTATTSGRDPNKLALRAIRLMASGSVTRRGMVAPGMGPSLIKAASPSSPRFSFYRTKQDFVSFRCR